MNVVLFGSQLNPLSGIAADYLNRTNRLSLIVVPRNRSYVGPDENVVTFISKAFVGAYRYFNVGLRCSKLKNSKNYCCLLEFIKANTAVPVLEFRPKSEDLENQILDKINKKEQGETVIFSCAFPYKIPTRFDHISRMVNMHPGILPENRGPNPYFWALATGKRQSGITFHTLTEKMDQGAILLERKFRILPEFSESKIEKLSTEELRTALPVFFENFDFLWTAARSQGKGAYYREPGSAERRKAGRLSIWGIRDILPSGRHAV